MFKTFLFSLGLTTYHYFNAIFLQADLVLPAWAEKISTIGLLTMAVYYLHKQNEKAKAESLARQERYEKRFDEIQERLFSVEKESIVAIKSFQGAMDKLSDTLSDIKEELQVVLKK